MHLAPRRLHAAENGQRRIGRDLASAPPFPSNFRKQRPQFGSKFLLSRLRQLEYRDQIGCKQRLGDQAGPGAIAKLDAAALIVAEGGGDAARGDTDVDLGMDFAKIRK